MSSYRESSLLNNFEFRTERSQAAKELVRRSGMIAENLD
jgi:hypothetical protein